MCLLHLLLQVRMVLRGFYSDDQFVVANAILRHFDVEDIAEDSARHGLREDQVAWCPQYRAAMLKDDVA